MRHPLIYILLLLSSLTCTASVEVKYSVTSKSRQNLVSDVKSKKENQEYKDIVAMMDKNSNKNYQLVVEGTTSSFSPIKPEKQIADHDPEIIIISNDYSDEERSIFLNLQTKQKTEVINFLMKNYVVRETLASLPWTLQDGEKDIMGLKCYRACIGDSVTAWYCMEIPISQGPEGYWGLPGIILDLETPTASYQCLSVDTQSKEKPEKERSGKEMTREGFKHFQAETIRMLKERR